MDHKCIQEFVTQKIDNCSGKGTNICSGINNMILEVWFPDTDGQEFAYDNWMNVKVSHCPFCGLKSCA